MKYHVPTGFGFSPKASGFYVFVSVPQYFSTEPITLPTAQYHHTPKRLTKTDSQTRTTTRNFTENQQVAFFSQSSQHCGPQPCELSFFSLPL
ncbi:MAG: hypothetical protein SPK27_00400 [Sodaliphilus sp.]|nr:hypothetical protein [Bacteroidales bacterium]MDY5866630.1 hypothetical protein [Sodaliphilus sp.]